MVDVSTRSPRRSRRPAMKLTRRRNAPRMLRARCSKHVTLHRLSGEKQSISVDEDESLLEAIERNGFEWENDCRMGVCMTCPAKIKLDTLKDVSVSSAIDQDASMLSEDVIQSGYVLTCVAKCLVDNVDIVEIEEDELLNVQLG